MRYTFNINLYFIDCLREKSNYDNAYYKNLVVSATNEYSWQKRCHGKEVIFLSFYPIGYILLDNVVIWIKSEWCSMFKGD